MEAIKPKKSDELTVLVFKDNHVARTFRVPLGWISRLGFALALSGFLFLATLILAARFYRSSVVSDPSRVRELEKQIAEMRGQVKEIEEAPLFAPTSSEGGVTLQPSDVAEPYAPFQALPAGYKLATGEAAQSVEIKNIEVAVREPKVLVKFWLQNTRRSGGTQQGRIIILARGPETLLTYPNGALNSAGAPSLLDPQRGEFFSISKFRETTAEFELRPDRRQESLREFEVFILGKGDEIILVKRIPFKITGDGFTSGPPVETTKPVNEKPVAPTPVPKPVTPPTAIKPVVPPVEAVAPPTSTPATEMHEEEDGGDASE